MQSRRATLSRPLLSLKNQGQRCGLAAACNPEQIDARRQMPAELIPAIPTGPSVRTQAQTAGRG